MCMCTFHYLIPPQSISRFPRKLSFLLSACSLSRSAPMYIWAKRQHSLCPRRSTASNCIYLYAKAATSMSHVTRTSTWALEQNRTGSGVRCAPAQPAGDKNIVPHPARTGFELQRPRDGGCLFCSSATSPLSLSFSGPIGGDQVWALGHTAAMGNTLSNQGAAAGKGAEN